MPDPAVTVTGLAEIERAFRAMGPNFQARLMGPSLGAMAAVVRRQAKRRNYGFMDRRRRLGYPSELGGGKYRDLRQSIRTRRIPAIYDGKKFRLGRAAVFAGGEGARQAHLVEEGHGGPKPARAHGFLRRALMSTQDEQHRLFATKLQTIFPRLASQIAARARTTR